ncbi:MAG: flippase-like domain-containing protein [Thermoleophilaceae bacterium]|nr:flippase-like domain-containing protein [Thermoleophilaceae bacterium]
MRVALVSPYSFTYPGGVGRHAEALASELAAQGHEVRLLAPYDPDDRLARAMHRGARPEAREIPDYLVPLGRTVGIPANGAVSNLSVFPEAVSLLRRELRHGRYDVIHVHEPNAPVVSWSALGAPEAPVVGTFHAYANRPIALGLAHLAGMWRQYNHLRVRIAVSEAARWTAERFAGGRYRIIPNGVDLGAAPAGPKRRGEELKILFLGRAEERKGLPVLLRAFEALHDADRACRLIVAGATPEEVDPYLLEREGVEIHGRVIEAEKWRLLHEADLLCAPSLGGESFGMVLTEAFACSTPVVASDIPGYRDVVRDGVDGVLVPPADPRALAETLLSLVVDREVVARMSERARERAERYAWPRVAEEVLRAYEDAIELPAPAGAIARAAVRVGLRPADGLPPRPPRRIPSLEPALPGAGRRRALKTARRVGVAAGGAAAVGLGALALQRIGLQSIADALIAATPTWVLLALALMCGSMLLRAEAWHAVLRAALPGVRVRRRDAARGTMIGVLMSATLPARLGEPSRALIVSRRLGRVRERLPLVLGTVVSQTILNLVALLVLGSVMFATVGVFKGHEKALMVVSIAPAAMLALVLAAPALLRRGKPSRFARVQAAANVARRALVQLRQGLTVFRHPRLGLWAAFSQLAAWAIQWLACYVLLAALGLDQVAGMGAAAAVLFAVNVTAVLPATPSNLGVFQAACVAVLSAYGVSHADALAYGIILQAVEIATALAMGMPALLREGMTWKDMRLRALHAAPVEISLPGRRRDARGAKLEQL